MRMLLIMLCLAFSICYSTDKGLVEVKVSAIEAPIDLALAENYFREAQEMSLRDNGKLWGVPLYGPMLFVDPDTRFIVTNQPDREGELRPEGKVFTGTLPKEENIANTAVKFAGVEWTMMMWPLPTDKQDRTRLMAHEQFHRIQNQLGLAGSNPANLHLDTRDGRVWLQLEWRALERALSEEGQVRRRSVEDALVFRAFRRSLFPNAPAEENSLEINEGLAEYTGVELSTHSRQDFAGAAACDLRQARRKPTFVRSFAYISGPAYGGLLNETGTSWRQNLKGSHDLGVLLQQRLAIKPIRISHLEALKRANAYDGPTLIAEETRRDNARQQQLAKFRRRFIEQPILILPLTPAVNYSYNPNNLFALGEIGTVYPTMRVSDNWGVIEVSNGALLIRENGQPKRMQVPLPENLSARPLKGDGWNLELSEGWILDRAPRQGDKVLKKVTTP